MSQGPPFPDRAAELSLERAEAALARPPRLGVSACLLGHPTRYDGGHRRHEFIAGFLARRLELVPVCPEMEAGLGAPRETMQLTGDPERPRLVTTETGLDRTELMERWARQRAREIEAAQLDGFILKSGSPSCGRQGVKVRLNSGEVVWEGIGLFAKALGQRLPHLPVIEETALDDPGAWEEFIRRTGAGSAGNLGLKKQKGSIP